MKVQPPLLLLLRGLGRSLSVIADLPLPHSDAEILLGRVFGLGHPRPFSGGLLPLGTGPPPPLGPPGPAVLCGPWTRRRGAVALCKRENTV